MLINTHGSLVLKVHLEKKIALQRQWELDFYKGLQGWHVGNFCIRIRSGCIICHCYGYLRRSLGSMQASTVSGQRFRAWDLGFTSGSGISDLGLRLQESESHDVILNPKLPHVPRQHL